MVEGAQNKVRLGTFTEKKRAAGVKLQADRSRQSQEIRKSLFKTDQTDSRLIFLPLLMFPEFSSLI